MVCVYNRERQIGACIESLAASRFRNFEIVAVDDGSTDRSLERLQALAGALGEIELRIERHDHNLGISAARNTGIDAARSDLIAFTDSDCTVDPDWAGALVSALDGADAAAVSGDVLDVAPRNAAERAFAGTSRIGRGALRRAPLVGNNMAFRSELLSRYRFDPAMTYYCDEEDLAWRLRRDGHDLAFEPRAKLFHDHRLDLDDYLRMAFRQGCGSARLWYKQRRWIGRDLPFLVVALLVLPLAILDRRFLLASAGALALHLAGLGYAEVALKGKPILGALRSLPLVGLYSVVKLAGVAWTRARIAVGREPAIVESRRGMPART